MLSVGAIRFEDRFCASRKGGTGGGGWVHRSGRKCMAAVAAARRSMPGGPFVCFLAQTGVETGVEMLLSPCRDSISGILGSF